MTAPPTNKDKSIEPSVVAEKPTLSPTTTPKTLSPTQEAKPCKDSQAKFKVGNQKLRCPAVYQKPDLCVNAKVSKLCPMACGICVSKPSDPRPDSDPEIPCKDSQAKFKVGKQKLKCPAVYERPDLCANTKVSQLCPMACGICKDNKPKPNVEDKPCKDSVGKVKYKGQKYTCDNVARLPEACDVPFIASKCPLSCKTCNVQEPPVGPEIEHHDGTEILLDIFEDKCPVIFEEIDPCLLVNFFMIVPTHEEFHVDQRSCVPPTVEKDMVSKVFLESSERCPSVDFNIINTAASAMFAMLSSEGSCWSEFCEAMNNIDFDDGPSDGPMVGEDVMCLDLMKSDKSFGNDLNCNFFAQPFDHWKCMNNQFQSECIIPGSTPPLHCDRPEHEPKEPEVEVNDGNVVENEETCKDVIGKFEFQSRIVNCQWASKKQWRCKNQIVAESCPNTCGFCK